MSAARGCEMVQDEVVARSWCTGYGGLEMAVRAAFGDFTVLSHSDIKPAAATLLAHRFPDVPNLGDMRAVDHTVLPRTDLMIGSWPCGPHSAAGKRLGEKDPRDLWPEYLRAIDGGRPAMFFGENVDYIASNGELRRVVTSLAERGYVGAWVVRSAADLGACHLRKRCFVVAVDPAADTVGDRLAQRHGPAHPGQEVQLGRDALRRDPRAQDRLTLLPTPTQNMTTGAGTQGRDGGMNLQTAVAYLPTPRATDGPKGGPGMRGSSGDLMLPSAVQPVNFGRYAEAVARHERVLGRPAPEPTKGITRAGNPQLNPAFVEWMMMLPEGWVCDVPDLAPRRAGERNAKLSLLGDGVVPLQGASAFRTCLDRIADRLAAGVAA